MNKKKTSGKYLLQLLKPYRYYFYATFILLAIAAIGVISGPKIFGEITTMLIQGFQLQNNQLAIKIDYAILNQKIILLVMIYVVSAVVNYISQYLMGVVASKINQSVRKALDEKINQLPISYLDSKNDGDIISTVINDVDTLFSALTQSLGTAFYSIILVIGILVMMFSISLDLTLIPILSVPFIIFLGGMIMKFSKQYFKKIQDKIAKLNVHVEEIYTNYTIVQSFNGQQMALEEFERINDDLVISVRKAQFLSGLLFPITAFVNNIAYVFAVIFGSMKVSLNVLNIGNMQSFIQYMQQFTNPLQQISQLGQFIQSSFAASERIVKLLNEKEIEERTSLQTLDDVRGEIEFKNVNFSYDKVNPIIQNFNLKVPQGSKVAIVGATGAGKTTLINLLMRFYEVDEGSITLDGVDMRNISRQSIANIFSMVLQDTWLFNGTIRENIAYGNEFTSNEEIEMAAKFANADHFIQTLPHGYDMVINEESNNLSQGQKQLITIARAFLGNKKILILDEATSSVDTRTEKLIQEAMNKLMYGKTAFIIAHRLSTIKNADIILVMDKGNVIEQGSHEELLLKDGAYATLYKSQFENE